MPARGGNGLLNHWIPAFAGMTGGEARIKAIRLPVCVYCFVVIPAKAGIHACMDARLQGCRQVERRREQTAEVIEPRLEQAAAEGNDGPPQSNSASIKAASSRQNIKQCLMQFRGRGRDNTAVGIKAQPVPPPVGNEAARGFNHTGQREIVKGF